MHSTQVFDEGPMAGVQPLAFPSQRRTRGRLFLFSFLITAVLALAYTWLRDPVYRSTALIRVDSVAASEAEPVPEAFVREQLVIHRHRLLGYQLLEEVGKQLGAHGFGVDTESLSAMLGVRLLEQSRLLELEAVGEDPALLAPALAGWIEHYRERFVGERSDATLDTRTTLQAQLQDLEERIAERREAMEAFRLQHGIVSLERDENRALAKVKALGAALDRAAEARAEAASQRQALQRAIERGETWIRPQDQRGLDQLSQRATELEETLKDYRQRFTEQYLAMDPQVQALERKLGLIRERSERLRLDSQRSSLAEADRTLASARDRESRLARELNAMQGQVQTSSTQLQTFAGMSTEMAALEEQAQQLRDRLVAFEVEAPHRMDIELLEPPYTPRKPYAPNYWRDTGISLAAALGFALLVVSLYRLLTPREGPDILVAGGMGLPMSEPEKLVREPAMALPDAIPEGDRILTAQECRALVEAADDGAELAVRLLLSGVQPQRLSGLRGSAFGPGGIELAGAQEGQLQLSEATCCLAGARGLDLESPLWRDRHGRPLGGEGIDTLISCAAFDAGLPGAAGISRRTLFAAYLRFIAQQGADPCDLVAHLGPLDADWLGYYQELPAPAAAAKEPVLWIHPAAD
ncbi:hypothetical protein [Motiliproteus sp. SC1-56]|uniref:GumC family protein n=1 Tax=Motiliproteus sp. SC1-56 TaxID=2799565 RepID=UPI001A8D080A|nr:hypothetical protein [Motiliproteus sp. SC1-56]